MQNEKFVNYYIESLLNHVNDLFQKNISLQVHHRINNETIQEQKEKIESIEKDISHLTVENKLLIDKLFNYENDKAEFARAKDALAHMDTFRNELIRARQELNDANSKHELELAELKQKIPSTIVTYTEPTSTKKIKQKKILKDGGNF